MILSQGGPRRRSEVTHSCPKFSFFFCQLFACTRLTTCPARFGDSEGQKIPSFARGISFASGAAMHCDIPWPSPQLTRSSPRCFALIQIHAYYTIQSILVQFPFSKSQYIKPFGPFSFLGKHNCGELTQVDIGRRNLFVNMAGMGRVLYHWHNLS